MSYLIQDFYYSHELNLGNNGDNTKQILTKEVIHNSEVIKQTEKHKEDVDLTQNDKRTKAIITEATKTIASLSLIKPTDVQSEYVQNIREKHPRAYEPWSKEEDELLLRLSKKIRDASTLSKIFFRKPSSIRSRIKKLVMG